MNAFNLVLKAFPSWIVFNLFQILLLVLWSKLLNPLTRVVCCRLAACVLKEADITHAGISHVYTYISYSSGVAKGAMFTDVDGIWSALNSIRQNLKWFHSFTWCLSGSDPSQDACFARLKSRTLRLCLQFLHSAVDTAFYATDEFIYYSSFF